MHKPYLHNPFETLHNRLDKLETLLERLLDGSVTHQAIQPEIGGLELAQSITGLSKARLYSLVSARIIPHSKRGNKLYFNRTELLAWVANGSRTCE